MSVAAGMRSLGAALALAAAATPAAAQSPVYIPLDDPVMATVDALVARGVFPRLSSLERPYLAADVRAAADSALAAPETIAPRAWLLAARRGATRYARADTPADRLRGFASVTPLVTAQTTGHRELMLGAGGDATVEPGGELRALLAGGNLAAVSRLRIDRALRHDPEFLGKKDRSLAARMEDAYLAARWRWAAVDVGRVARNWGPAALDGLQIGRYADSYDHVRLRVGVERLHLTATGARLDDMRVSAAAVPDTVIAQRYMSAHRLAGRWRALEVAASEMIVYGGPGRGFEPALANPLSLLNLAQYSEGESLNVSYALDVAWRPGARGLYAVQFMLDDFQLDDCAAGCDEPPSLGLTLGAEAVPLRGSARGFASYTRVSNLAYRTPSPWEQVTSRGLGLGRGQSDYDEARLGVELPDPTGGVARLYAAHRRQGEGDYRLPFPPPSANRVTPEIFAGVVTRVTRLGAQWTRSGRVGVRLDVGYQWTSNFAHVPGRSASGIEGRLRIALEDALSLDRLLAP